MDQALEKDALYYPYIKIQSANWLKSTLLCFPHVRRIVPGDYVTNDQKSIRPFTTTKGIDGYPLLRNVEPKSSASYSEQSRLEKMIRQHAEEFRRHFSKEVTLRKYPSPSNRYEIYGEKFKLNLLYTLVELELAWAEPDREQWYSLHPRLGRAVMATIAIAIANESGFDIVTADNTVHRSVCTQRQEDVFDELTGYLRNEAPRASEGIVHELASVFMTTYFDVSKLSVEQIVELQKEGKDLKKFKNAILPIAGTIPDIPDPTERQRRLKAAAAEINSEWRKYKRSLPMFALDAIFNITEAKLPLGASAALGAATYMPFGVVAGIAVGFTTFAGWGVWEKFQKKNNSPYQYLNRIHRAGATLHVPTSVERT